MLDFDRTWLTFPCSRCEFPNDVSLREVRFGLPIPCRGCKANIQLQPRDGTFDQGKKMVERALQEFLNQTITINIQL